MQISATGARPLTTVCNSLVLNISVPLGMQMTALGKHEC